MCASASGIDGKLAEHDRMQLCERDTVRKRWGVHSVFDDRPYQYAH
jgi:hypothetical protein